MSRLKNVNTEAPEKLDKDDVIKKTKKMVKRIAELQELLCAEGKNSLLIVLQGMDSSGKDGTTRAIFKYCSPNGVKSYSYKKPTEEEFAHDFLWRVHKNAPSKGQIAIFNRSHYEDVLIQRVHGWIDEEHAEMRYEAINAWEKLLQKDNNTTILKFFLNLSHDKQEEELMERVEIPEKHWKHNDGDWEQRKHWNKYMEMYEIAFEKCNQPEWIIIPADNGWYRNYSVAKVVLETLENLNMKYPKLDSKLFSKSK